MSLLNPPYCLQAEAEKHSAELFRDAVGSFLGSAGVGTAGDLALTQKGAPDMHVLIAAGQVWIKGTVAGSGYYYTRNTASIELAIPASDAANPRIETIIVRVKDAQYEGAANEVVAEAVKGVAEPGAELGNLKGAGVVPSNSIVLGYVLVPAKAVSVVTADILNTATTFNTWAPSRISWGRIGLKGEILAGSGDYTVTHVGEGVYKVVWNTARASTHYAVTFGAFMTGSAANMEGTNPGTGNFTVNTITASTGVPGDFGFNFIAIGP